jgi:melibiose permease/lactose/raffinose/galactose permease
MFYLTDVLDVHSDTLWWITGIILASRIFDACNDPVMGLIVDNTHSRFGKYKPWIVLGALSSGVITVLLFSGIQLTGGSFIVLFAILYVLWGVCYTTNDISYWSLLPALSKDQHERESIGAIARVCASIGLFFVVAGIQPLTETFGEVFGGLRQGYFAFAVLIVGIMWLGQSITVFFVKESKAIPEDHTSLKELIGIVIKNDQLLYTSISMALFMVGYLTTSGFGQYYFKYVYQDTNMYNIFALILGASQITALSVFPVLAKRFERSSLYKFAAIIITVGYVLFFFASINTMLYIGIAGVLIFAGQAFIQMLTLMFLADSVEYGHWKLGKRNGSITFSLQPFINKIGGAVSGAVVSSTVIVSGISDAASVTDVTPQGLLMLKISMMVFPLICIIVSFIIYRRKYKIDRKMYDYIVWELEQRENKK